MPANEDKTKATPVKPTDEAPKTEAAPATAATEAPAKEKKTKAPLPEGYVTPVTFAHLLSEKRTPGNANSVRPQIIYGYLKNNAEGSKNPFPAKQNSDGAWIVNEKDAFAWMDALEGRKTEREAKKATEAAKVQVPASTTTAPEPAAANA